MRKLVASSVLASLGVLVAARAEAHFTLDAFVIGSETKKPISWMPQDATGGPQKTGPCAGVMDPGMTKAPVPTKIVTDLKAGQMVSITVSATVAHPGWYRVALIEGPSSSQTATTLPEPPVMAGTMCTPAIMSNPIWSPTQPVIADGLPPGSMASTNQSGTKMLNVTIPQNATCTTAKPCTLQVIMVMTDHTSGNCNYHHCADITTSGGATSGSGGAGGGSGSGGAGGAKASGGTTGTNGSGGATASGGANGTGGSSASGGADGTGGSAASGGANASSGGSSSSGGSTSTGGALASGGSASTGGKSGSGGTSGSGGSNTSSGSGGTMGPGGTDSPGGCSVASRGGAALTPFAALLLVALARRRRTR